MQERLMSLDEFNTPKVLEGNHAAVTNICRLIIMEPGTFPMHPEMGIGLYSKYRYGWEDEVKVELKSDLTKQIQTYLPQLSGVSVQVNSKDKKLYVTVTFDSTVVTFVANTEDQEIGILSNEGDE